MPISFLTHKLLPKMLERNHKCAVINLSSFAAHYDLPICAAYCAGKHFDDFFSKSLDYEYKEVDFLSVRPALVTTPLTRNTSSLIHVNKNSCVRGSLRSLGHRRATYGHLWHEIQGIVAEFVPKKVTNIVMGTTQH